MANRIYPNVYRKRQARREVANRYRKRTYVSMTIRWHKETENDIIEKLDGVENKKDYLRNLIREDLAKNKI